VECPYDFGVITQVINEPLDMDMNTSAWRSVYSSMSRGAEEILVDEIAAKLKKDPYEFRRKSLKDDKQRAVLDKVAEAGEWGKKMPAGHAQGIAYHQEYRSRTACLVEMDATDPKNPRVYKATIAVDVGLPINPLGLKAQMIGGLTDAISTVLQAGLHFDNGLPLEGSYSQFHYARQKGLAARGAGVRHAGQPRQARRLRRARSTRGGRRDRQRVRPRDRYQAAQLPDQLRRRLRTLPALRSRPVPKYTFTVNGETKTVDAPADLPMLWALRDKLGITGPKYGCGINVCKACTSHLDGKAFNPCQTPVSDCAGKDVTTIEGLADSENLHPVQEAWLEMDVAQCGFCQPGQIMATVALLQENPNPTDEEIDAIENVCRCGTYHRIREAIKKAAAEMS